MTESTARVVGRSDVHCNPWVTLVRKDVAFAGETQDFYSLALPDYVAVVALTVEGKVLLVRQFRPAVEELTLELPAGTVDAGEGPQDCAVRELLEETGHRAKTVQNMGAFRPDTGRLGNRQHIFLVHCDEGGAAPDFVPEPGVEVLQAYPAELEKMILDHRFDHLLHISALYLCGVLPSQASHL